MIIDVRHTILIACLVAGLAPAAIFAQTDLTRQQQADFAWFDTLGFPSVAGRPLVRVATGLARQIGNGPLQNQTLTAFLLEEDAATFRVLTMDLFTRTFTKTVGNVPPHEFVGYEKLDLGRFARERLDALRNPRKDDDPWHRFGERLGERTEVFFLARCCAAHGQPQLARELLDESAKMPARRQPEEGKPEPSLREKIAKELAYSLIWRYTLEFGDPQIPRSRLLEEFDRFAAAFPDDEHAASAKETAALLRKMVAEDEARRKNPPAPLDKMTLAEKVADLIYQLRDQNGQQWSQPGACDIFMDERGEASPASQLVKLGFDAVPALIEALDDNRLTRSVGYHRNFYFSHHVLRVCDCAEAILSRVAGRPFYVQTYTAGYMSKDDKQKEIKAAAGQWWRDVQTRGERQVLIEATMSGDERITADQARRLVEKYPADALDPLIRGARAAKKVYVRESLVELTGGLEGDKPVAFLLEELKSGPWLAPRVEAARALHRRNRPEALAIMLDLWQTAKEQKVSDWDTEGAATVMPFLVESNDARAVRALADGMSRHGVALRMALIEKIADAVSENNRQPPPEAVLAPMEALLAGALKDTEEQVGLSGSRGDASYTDPRVCDAAAYFLAKRWPQKYGAFDWNATRRLRDRRRLEMLNLWRSGAGQPPVPLPPVRVNTVRDEDVRPLLNAVGARDLKPEQREEILAKLRALGPDATEAVAFRAAMRADADAPDAPALSALARELSCVVRSVETAEGSVAPDEPLRRLLDDQRGKPLTAERFIQIVTHTLGAPPPGAGGIELTAEREEDGGITLTLRLPPGKKPLTETTDFRTRKLVSVGRENTYNSSGSTSLSSSTNPKDYDDFYREISKALTGDPLAPLEIRSTVTAPQ